MTLKLFADDSLLKECTCHITACTEKNGVYLVETDQTVFFPEGGGQLSDRGQLGAAIVKHVSEKNGHIYHECDQALEVGSEVKAKIDWSVRLDRMQQHCGEHLLSYACWKLYQANNVGFRMNEDIVTIDVDKELTTEQLLEIEHLTNELIWENRPVSINYMDSTEAVCLKDRMRKFNDKLTGTLRIVTIEDADVCTCCGTHPPFTGMIGSVKIIRHEKHKQGCRIEFLCGRRALLDADNKNTLLNAIAADFSTKVEAVPEHLVKQKEEIAALKENLKQKTHKLLELELNEKLSGAPVAADGIRVLCLPIVGGDGKESKLLLPRLSTLEKTVAVVLSVLPQRMSYVCVAGAATDRDCREVIRTVNERFGGRGGGKPDCAQGGADYCNDWQEKLQQVEEKLLG